MARAGLVSRRLGQFVQLLGLGGAEPEFAGVVVEIGLAVNPGGEPVVHVGPGHAERLTDLIPAVDGSGPEQLGHHDPLAGRDLADDPATEPLSALEV